MTLQVSLIPLLKIAILRKSLLNTLLFTLSVCLLSKLLILGPIL